MHASPEGDIMRAGIARHAARSSHGGGPGRAETFRQEGVILAGPASGDYVQQLSCCGLPHPLTTVSQIPAKEAYLLRLACAHHFTRFGRFH
jgi:hypothetical protein